jgi:hypothetical protein
VYQIAIDMSATEIESPRRLNFAEFQPIETKICATCKRIRSMSKFSEFQFGKEFGDCLDCVYLYGKHRKESKPANRRNNMEFRLSALHASPRKEEASQSPRNRKYSVAHDRIVIDALDTGVKLFHALDVDRNGSISRAELIRGLTTNDALRAVCDLFTRYFYLLYYYQYLLELI